jgi:hypothetical protein
VILVPSALQTVKLWLVGNMGLAKDALHVYVGLALFLGAALAFKWQVRSWKPWAIVVAAALLGEVWDLRDSLAYHTRIGLWANFHDIWNTCFWPSLIVLLARTTRLFRR